MFQEEVLSLNLIANDYKTFKVELITDLDHKFEGIREGSLDRLESKLFNLKGDIDKLNVRKSSDIQYIFQQSVEGINHNSTTHKQFNNTNDTNKNNNNQTNNTNTNQTNNTIDNNTNLNQQSTQNIINKNEQHYTNV